MVKRSLSVFLDILKYFCFCRQSRDFQNAAIEEYKKPEKIFF